MELLKNLEGMTPDEQMTAVLELQKAAMANLEEQRQVSIGKSAELVIQGLKKIKSDFEVKFDSLNYDIQSKVASLKDGNPGRDGATGKDGRDGLPGRDGQNGQNGKDGQDGQDGADGVSVTDAKIDFDGSLVITLSSGREINVGEVVAPDLAEKIKVITNGGGTSQGVLDAIAALQTQIDNLIPSQTGNAGKYLTTDGTNTSWATVAGGGSVTAVTGTSPIVSSGGATPAISLASGYGDTQNPYASKTANFVLAAPDGASGAPTFRAVVAADIPTLNQNTTGTAANVTGTVAFANGGTGETTRQAAIDALAGAVTSGQYLRGNGTDVVMSAIQAADVPTLNQNTTGTAANVTGIVAVANGGTGTATPSLVAGTNITISGTFPNQTINGAGSSLTVQDEGTTLTSAATSLNFTGAGVTATNTGGAVEVAITGGGGGGIPSADIQEFTSTGTSTWTKPAGAKLVYVLMFGGGGGGGSGRRRATLSAATTAAGGGGGGGGGRTELWIPAAALGSTETVTVGAGGTGGTANTADNTNGNTGNSGQSSSFGSWALARAGNGGAGGATTSGTGGSGGGGLGEYSLGSTTYTASGGSGNTTTGGAGNRGGYRPGGGGGGAGLASGATFGNPGQLGGKGGSLLTSSTLTTGGGGSSSSSDGNGGNGSNSTAYFVGGDGGGAGGSGLISPGSGGNGGYPGGGGGGGGAGQGVNSGAGGNGGDGYVRVVTFF